MNPPTLTEARAGRKSIQNAMTPAERLALIQRVLAKAFDETNSWEYENFGCALAYLALAISDCAPDSFVDWSEECQSESTEYAAKLFQEWFPPSDPVWQFIRI